MDLISRVGVIALMGLWWWRGGGGACGCWSYFGISIQRLRLVSLGLGGFGVSWGLHHLGGNPIDMDSNKILHYVCFSFSGNCVQS